MPRKKNVSKDIKEIYINKTYVIPKEQALETIFEIPRKSKDGPPILTSVKKYKRYLHFDPSTNKIQKRKQKAKKCLSKFKFDNRVTRSSPQNSNCTDVSMRILEILGDSSNDSNMDVTSITPETAFNTQQVSAVDEDSGSVNESINNLQETPKRSFNRRPSVLQEEDKDLIDAKEDNQKICDSEESGNKFHANADSEAISESENSPWKTCSIS